MEFGEIPTDTAEGAILAHSHRLEGRVLKKGRTLSRDDVRDLLAAGHKSVVCARLTDADMAEDEAANLLADAVSGGHLTRIEAFTGRVNLYAKEAGIVVYDEGRLDAFNLVDEAITLGIVPPYQAVAPGQMVATLKIIPFGLPRFVVQIARSLAERAERLVRVAPYRPAKVGLIQTTLPGMKDSVLDGTARVTSDRLSSLASELVEEVRVQHSEAATARAIERMLVKAVDLILIAGASAVVDRRDVIPASIGRVGGTVTHFGMPVDPGNLMLTGKFGSVPVFGMPGCARSPKLNGFDWVLQRAIAGLPITPSDIMRMGAGGLLKDIPTRPLPRAKAERNSASETEEAPGTEASRAPKVAAIVLAAGQSRRMGRSNKLLAEIDGMTMVRRTVRNIAASSVLETVVVTGHEREKVLESLSGLVVRDVHNPDYDGGLSTSLAAGLSALDDDVDGVIVCLGDMPRVTSTIVNKLIAAYDPIEGRAICVPTQNGKRGNPVLWDRRFFADMGRVSGDVGARHLIGAHAELVAEVEMNDEAVLIDIDTPDALAKFGGRTADRDPPGEA